MKLLCTLIAVLVAAGCTPVGQSRTPITEGTTRVTRIQTGAEQLVSQLLPELAGKRIGLVCNHTSMVFDTVHLRVALQKAGIRLTKLFAPEHGYAGQLEAGAHVPDGQSNNLEIISLHGTTKKPKPEHLANLDLLLFDLQDAGARFYTYSSTLGLVLEACAEHGVPVWVLDRPNPNGFTVDGPVLQPTCRSFLGYYPVPVLHGLTLGELARMLQGEQWIKQADKLKLRVIPMQGYRHRLRWPHTGLPWVPPSPNLPTPAAAEAYPYTCLLEGTLVSEGRGTPRPFQTIGFPYHTALAKAWVRDTTFGTQTVYTLRGLTAYPARFIPRSIPDKATKPKFQDTICWGLDSLTIQPESMEFGTAYDLVAAFLHEYTEHRKRNPLPRPFFLKSFDLLAGDTFVRHALTRGYPYDSVRARHAHQLDDYRKTRNRYLLYE